MAKKVKGDDAAVATPLDLAARIGARARPVDEPVPPVAPPDAQPLRLDGPLPPRRAESWPLLIGGDEPPAAIIPAAPAVLEEGESTRNSAIPSPRTPPGPGETDIVATPLPTLDDWHRFELALRAVRGVGQVRTEYYRHGVLKVRVAYAGSQRLAHALRDGIRGYSVRVIGEDRSTLQILVSTEAAPHRSG